MVIHFSKGSTTGGHPLGVVKTPGGGRVVGDRKQSVKSKDKGR